jgi:glycosyltransferase involved in cell wall biosynthesis
MTRLKLAIISTHPIQYYAPVFRALAADRRLEPRVFFSWSQAASGALHDPGFGAAIQWDVPLLEGYAYEFVENRARNPGSHHFWGIRNPALVSTIEAWGADALLVYGWNLASHLGAMRHFKGRRPVFFRGDSTLLDVLPAARVWVRKRLLTWVYRHIDVAIAVGQNNRDYYRWCAVPAKRIAFAPHSVDTDRFRDSSGEHAHRASLWRAQAGIPEEALVFLYAAKFIAKKAPSLLMEAFRRLDTTAHLVFVGNGALEADLKASAAGRANIHFLPFQNQSLMPSVYKMGDVFVLPSCGPGETWGLAMNEAMASGRAVIASSKAGGARDLIKPKENGWLFDAGDLQGLTRALSEALDSGRAALQAMGAAAQKMSADWSTDAAARGIGDCVERFTRPRQMPMQST